MRLKEGVIDVKTLRYVRGVQTYGVFEGGIFGGTVAGIRQRALLQLTEQTLMSLNSVRNRV